MKSGSVTLCDGYIVTSALLQHFSIYWGAAEPPNSLLGAPLIVDIVAFPPYCCRFSVFYPYCLSRNFPHVAFEQPAQKAKAASTTEMQMDS